MAKKTIEETKLTPPMVIHFTPACQCFWCERITNVAHLDGCSFRPVCPWHGYYCHLVGKYFTQEQRVLVEESVVRFALAYHKDMGEARVLARIKPELVPGLEGYDRAEYEMYLKFPHNPYQSFIAWVVDYHRYRVHKRGYVVLDEYEVKFSWFPEKKK